MSFLNDFRKISFGKIPLHHNYFGKRLGPSEKFSIFIGYKNITLILVFQSLGTVFRDIVAGQHSLWVISEALDAIFDTFADGPLVNTAAASIGLMTNLQQLAPVLKTRVRNNGDVL